MHRQKNYKKRGGECYLSKSKKILSIVTAFCMLYSSSAYAANVATIYNGTVSVSGDAESGKKMASLILYDNTKSETPDENNIIQIKQTEIKNGKYNFEFPFEMEGNAEDYSVRVNVGNPEQSVTLTLQEVEDEVRDDVVLTRIDDAINRDRTFNIYGEGLNTAGLQFFASKIESVDDINNVNSTEKILLQQVNIDQEGNYAQLLMPKNVTPCAYRVWAQSENLLTNTVYANKARPQWISDNMISAGVEVLVSGKNMYSSEWGGTTDTQIKLTNSSTEYFAQVIESNPFAVKFTISDSVPTGEYDVMVSNDGILWSSLENGDRLIVVESTDPYNLGVAWGDVFGTATYSVTNYGANGSDNRDDTTALQNAIDAASENGGKVYVPNGTYYFTKLTLKDNIVIEGESKAGAILCYKPSYIDMIFNQNELNSMNAIDSDAVIGKQGIINLTITVDDSVDNDCLPLNILFMGNSSNKYYADSRACQYGFIKNVNIVYDKGDIPSKLTLGKLQTVYKDHFIVDGCEFVGFNNNLTSAFAGKYFRFINNVVDTYVGCVYVYSQYSVFEGNTITRAANNTAEETDYGTQGIYTRSDSYVARNTFTNSGNRGTNGEIAAAEEYRGGTKMYGTIVSADGTSVTVNPKTNTVGAVIGSSFASGNNAWDFTRKVSGDWHIVIVDGKGTGQYRRIVSGVSTTNTIEIEREWDGAPDTTSKFSVVMPLKNITYYDNDAENCSWGYILYGPTIDCVIADNRLTNCGGIQIHVIQTTDYDTQGSYATTEESEKMNVRKNMGYFNRITRNELNGTSWVGHTVEISAIVKLEYGYLFGRPIIGLNISDNTIVGDGKTPEEVLSSRDENMSMHGLLRNGITLGKEIKLTEAQESGNYRPSNALMYGINIEGNTLKNICDGIIIGGTGYSYGDADTDGVTAKDMSIRNNLFEDVANEFTEYTSDVKMTQWDGVPVQIDNVEVSEGKVVFNMENSLNKIINGVVVVASYNNNNALKKVYFKDLMLQGIDNDSYEIEISEIVQGDNVKIFYWTSMKELKPIAEIGISDLN